MHALSVLCALVVPTACAACDRPSEMIDAGQDTIDPVDGRICTRPILDPSDFENYMVDVVTRLSATPRATVSERANARELLIGELMSFGWEPSAVSYPGGANVIAVVPPTIGNEKLIIVGAHFDTVTGSPGANDNASGVGVVLALARLLTRVPCRSAPVALVLFDQEETGLFGARAYAQQLSLATTRAVHTIDQVAWDADGDRRFELELPSPSLETEWRAAAQDLDVPLTVTNTSGTDHQAFRERGFDAVGLTEEYVGNDTSPHRHMPSDTSASILPYKAYMSLAAQLTSSVLLNEISP